MKLEISFYYRKYKEGIECTSSLNTDFKGFGINEYEACKDYFAKFNKWSAEMKAEVKEILDKKGISYVVKDWILIQQ